MEHTDAEGVVEGPAQGRGRDVGLDNQDAREVTRVVERGVNRGAEVKADNRGGAHPQNIKKPLNLRRRIREELDRKAPFGLKDLAINGNDLLQHGYAPGPKIGEKLNELLELVLDEPELNTREELLKRI